MVKNNPWDAAIVDSGKAGILGYAVVGAEAWRSLSCSWLGGSRELIKIQGLTTQFLPLTGKT